jgi:hypothetical protein
MGHCILSHTSIILIIYVFGPVACAVLPFGPCPAEVQGARDCASFPVPLDHDFPDGPTIPFFGKRAGVKGEVYGIHCVVLCCGQCDVITQA